MVRRLPLVVALLLLTSLAAAATPDPSADLQPWKPELSYQGGAQSDPRLDQPVKFWRAGLTLREVFDGVEAQAGVTLDFSPPDDENARLPVNLFLNEKDPPSLRSLMAQLSWVTECIFSYRGEEGSQVYSLMRTSLGEGAEARLHKEAALSYAESEAAINAMPARLEAIQEALKLSRDEAIAQYRGKDDDLLLTVLDKKRRAAAELASPYTNEILDNITVPREPNSSTVVGGGPDFSELKDGEWALLQTAFGLPDSLLGDETAHFNVLADSLGGLCVKAPYFWPGDPRKAKPGEEPTIWIIPHPWDQRSAFTRQVELEDLLGEKRTPEQQRQRVEELLAERAVLEKAEGKQLREKSRALSPSVEELLAHTMLDDPAPFWRVQEEVASATGLNVVADALWENVLGSAVIREKEPTQTPALTALERFTSASLPRPRPQDSELARWSWGDAGTFLRFRAPERDVWRAARLPDTILVWADGLVAPYLPKPTEARPKSVDIKLRTTPEQWFRALGRLSDLQLRYGADESYGDPKGLAVALRLAVLRAALRFPSGSPEMARLLAQLDDDQWRALKGSGLGSTSFNASQREAFTRYLDRLHFTATADRPAPSEGKLTMRGGDIVSPLEDKFPVPDPSRYSVLAMLQGRTPRGMMPVAAAGGGDLPAVIEVHVDLPTPAPKPAPSAP